MSEPRLILIVERDRYVRRFQEHFLGRAGFAVRFVDDGAAALDHARLYQPGVVVTEILVPKIDGLALCRRLREDPLTAHIPVIIFSILAAGSRASEAGARAFLRKPLVESLFITTVQDAMAAAPELSMERQ
ncbi:MAG TPA: response regulator [Longimicrobiales bacterium]|nr:response regulator [Longimicrobiales bacterium]